MNANLMLKTQVTEMQLKLDVEKNWWENKRANIQSDFMKELESDGKPTDTTQRPKTASDSSDDAVLVETGGPADQGSKKKKGKKGVGA